MSAEFHNCQQLFAGGDYICGTYMVQFSAVDFIQLNYANEGVNWIYCELNWNNNLIAYDNWFPSGGLW